MTLDEAEDTLRRDGRYEWLLGPQPIWSVKEIQAAYKAAFTLSLSHDTVMRWFKRLPAGGAENYPGTIGWRAKRNALIMFFATGSHLRKSASANRSWKFGILGTQ